MVNELKEEEGSPELDFEASAAAAHPPNDYQSERRPLRCLSILWSD